MMQLSEAFAEIVALATRLGMKEINKLDGCWEYQVDDRWWFAINGHQEHVRCSAGTNVPPFTVYVQYNGWPAGVIDPAGGIIAAGECANEDTFIAALKSAPKPAPQECESQTG